MSEEIEPSSAPVSTVLASAARPRFVVRRDGKLEPLNGVATRADADERIEREITAGQVQEVDLYIYAGTYKPKRMVETIDVFKDQ
jgi:hypothetical protein